jgi:uncharacterized protein (TIGR03435 family)
VAQASRPVRRRLKASYDGPPACRSRPAESSTGQQRILNTLRWAFNRCARDAYVHQAPPNGLAASTSLSPGKLQTRTAAERIQSMLEMQLLTRLTLVAALALSQSKPAPAQLSQQFETAVIRPTLAAANAGTSFNLFEGGRLRIVNEPVKLLIRIAFQIQNAQIAGGPDWLESAHYDIEAKTGFPEKIKPDRLRPLMQSLLAECFNLKFHRETRELTVYALVAAKDGPKLKSPAEGESASMNTTGGPKASHVTATATSMESLAGYIGNRLGRIVLDKTGLSGSFDFKLDWSPDEAPDSSSPSLVTALREQLGLRLESQKSPVEILVVDSIDKPSEN